MNIPAVTHKGVPLLPVWQIETFFDGGTLVLICKRSKHCLAVVEGHMHTDAHRERRGWWWWGGGGGGGLQHRRVLCLKSANLNS